MRYECAFNLKDRVIMDGDESIVATVTSVMFETTGCSVRVSWISDCQVRREWIEDWRLSPWVE